MGFLAIVCLIGIIVTDLHMMCNAHLAHLLGAAVHPLRLRAAGIGLALMM